MDLLPSPTGESILGRTPFVGGRLRWDGGSFLHFACRNGWLENVPMHMRKCDCPLAYRDRKWFKPLEQGDKETFMQTWLFFGLLAEFYGLNDEEPALRSAHSEAVRSGPDRDAGIQAMYADFVKPDPATGPDGINGDDQDRYVTGAILDDSGEGDKIARHLRQKQGGDDAKLAKYLDYLHECLVFTNSMISHLGTSRRDFRPSISVPIAALGEIYHSLLHILAKTLGVPRRSTAKWDPNYLRTDRNVQAHMLQQGWCRSDIERIRESFHGLATRHFLSHMAKPVGSYSHDSCSALMCQAAQIDSESYVLTHDDGCSGCDIVGVDQEEVKRILTLKNGDSFPVLQLEVSGGGDGRVVNIYVEEYDESRPYVALSHVWADGLGNPAANALQSCQIGRLARLIQEMPSQVAAHGAGPVEDREPAHYRFWIDTLCCPVDRDEKLIALERIAAVYSKAAHVLVLDKSISPFLSKGEGPIKASENCLRIVASATWMRRLWTLQEGALAKSLYFQFKDGPVDLTKEIAKLRDFGSSDLRYKPIYENVALMLIHFKNLCSPNFAPYPPEPPDAPPHQHARRRLLDQLETVQSSLYFRSVSVPSDEPLCIATLLSLDSRALPAAAPCRQVRMATVWRLVAAQCGGAVTARVLFYNDQPLGLASLDGWRWAPKSLLPSPDASGLSYDAATSRLIPPEKPCEMGTVTDRGLRVVFPGLRIVLRPWGVHASGRVWPWHVFTRPFVENNLLLRDRTTGRWATLSGASKYSNSWTWEEWAAADARLLEEDKGLPWEGRRPSQPIFNELCRDGQFALIRDTRLPGYVEAYLLVKLLTADAEESGPLHAHACFTVSVTELAAPLWPGLNMLRSMAMQIYGSDVNQKLLRFLAGQEGGRDPDPEDEECKRLVETVREEMKRVSKEALAQDQEGYLARVAEELVGEGKQADVWKVMVLLMPFDISVESLPDDQIWVVDRPAVGDGVCHDECCR